METKQADAAAEAILEPHLRAQQARSEDLRARKVAEEALQARKRRVAWIVLFGAGIGVAITYVGGFRFVQGILWGGLAGSAIGWLITRRAAQQSFKPNPFSGSA